MNSVELSKREFETLLFETVSFKIVEGVTEKDIDDFEAGEENFEKAKDKGFQRKYTPQIYNDLVDFNKDEYTDYKKLSHDVRDIIKQQGKPINRAKIDRIQKDITNKMRVPGDNTPDYTNINMMPNTKIETFYQEVHREKVPKVKGKTLDWYIENASIKVKKYNGEEYPFYDKRKLPNSFSECPERMRVFYGDINKTLEERYYIKRTKLNQYEVSGDTFTYGNIKLPPNILIINLNSGSNCPNKYTCKFSAFFNGKNKTNNKLFDLYSEDNTDQINAEINKYGVCYAQADERIHSKVERRNIRNEFMFEKIEFNDLIKLIEVYINTSSYKIDYVRINESGDFKNEMQVKAANAIAKYLKKKYNINTSCYCNNLSLAGAFVNAKDLILNASNKKFAEGATRFYFAMKEEFFDKVLKDKGGDNKIKQRKKANGEIQDYFICCCNCYNCNLCYKTAKEAEGEYGQMKGNEGKLYVYSHIH